MFIVHVTFIVRAPDRDRALATLVAAIDPVRALPGCIAFVPFLHPVDPQEVGIQQQWESHKDFTAYLQSDSFRALTETLRPVMVAAPVSKRFDARLVA